MLLEDLLRGLADALDGYGNHARVGYARHVEKLANTATGIPATPSALQVTHLKPLIADQVEWEGDLYLRDRDGKLWAEFAPDGAPRRRGKGVGHLKIVHRAGQTPEGLGRVRDAADDALDTRLQHALAEAQLAPAKQVKQHDRVSKLIDGLKSLIDDLETGEETDGN